MRKSAWRAPLLLAVSLALPAQVEGQQWSLEAYAGKLRYQAGPASVEPTSLVLGLGYDDPRSGLRLSAGVPTAAKDPLWGAAGAWTRLAVGRRVVAGLDLIGDGFVQRTQVETVLPGRFPWQQRIVTSDSWGFGVAGQAMPVVALETGWGQFQARTGLAHHYSEFGGEGQGRTVRVSDLQLTLAPASLWALRAELRRFGAGEGSYTYGGLTGYLVYPQLTVWGTLGRWFGSDSAGLPWAAGAMLRIGERFGLSFSSHREVVDPLYQSPPRTSWGIGLSIRLGAPPSLREPVPASYVDGVATVLLPVSEAPERPLIAGDFNHWKPEPMTRVDGNWSYTVKVAPGVYHYAFVTADGKWFVPESVPGRKDDGMGGHVAVLVVR